MGVSLAWEGRWVSRTEPLTAAAGFVLRGLVLLNAAGNFDEAEPVEVAPITESATGPALKSAVFLQGFVECAPPSRPSPEVLCCSRDVAPTLSPLCLRQVAQARPDRRLLPAVQAAAAHQASAQHGKPPHASTSSQLYPLVGLMWSTMGPT